MNSSADVFRSPTLPRLSPAVLRLIAALDQPAFQLEWVPQILQEEPNLGQVLMEAARHPYFAALNPVHDVSAAVRTLGLIKATALVIYGRLRATWDVLDTAGSETLLRYRQKTAIHVAVADCLEDVAPGLPCGTAFLAATCMRVGETALLATDPERYLQLVETAYLEQRALHTVEEMTLGFTHIEVAARLLAAWRLPDAVQTAVRHQQAPIIRLLQSKGDASFELLKIIAIAAGVGEYICGPDCDSAWLRLQALTTEHLEYDDTRLSELIGRARARGIVLAELLGIPVDGLWEDESGCSLTGSAIIRSGLFENPAPGDEDADDASTEAPRAAPRNAALHDSHVLADDVTSCGEDGSAVLPGTTGSSSVLASVAGAAGSSTVLPVDSPILGRHDSVTMTANLRDPLTRAYARAFFEEMLDKALAHCRRNAAPIGILALDVDEFGRLNAIHGAQAGDFVLREITQVCLRLLRECDVFARYAGDEFVVLVSEPTEKGLHELGERIRTTIERQVDWPDGSRSVTVTVGAVLALPHRRDTNLASRLVSSALKAARRAKENNQRNSVNVTSLVNDVEKRIRKQIVPTQFSRWLVQHGRFDIAAISRAIHLTQTRHRRIGELARHFGFLQSKQIEAVLREQRRTGNRFGITAIQLGLLTETETVFLLAQQRESAAALGDTLIELGLLTQDELNVLLREYLDTAIGTSLERTLADRAADRGRRRSD